MEWSSALPDCTLKIVLAGGFSKANFLLFHLRPCLSVYSSYYSIYG